MRHTGSVSRLAARVGSYAALSTIHGRLWNRGGISRPFAATVKVPLPARACVAERRVYESVGVLGRLGAGRLGSPGRGRPGIPG
jgi:hypothetical protein